MWITRVNHVEQSLLRISRALVRLQQSPASNLQRKRAGVQVSARIPDQGEGLFQVAAVAKALVLHLVVPVLLLLILLRCCAGADDGGSGGCDGRVGYQVHCLCGAWRSIGLHVGIQTRTCSHHNEVSSVKLQQMHQDDLPYKLAIDIGQAGFHSLSTGIRVVSFELRLYLYSKDEAKIHRWKRAFTLAKVRIGLFPAPGLWKVLFFLSQSTSQNGRFLLGFPTPTNVCPEQLLAMMSPLVCCQYSMCSFWFTRVGDDNKRLPFRGPAGESQGLGHARHRVVCSQVLVSENDRRALKVPGPR